MVQDLVVQFKKLGETVQGLSTEFPNKIENVKRSILYDFQNKLVALEALIKTVNEPPVQASLQLRDNLPDLPIKNLQDFLNFEQNLTENEETKLSLVIFFIVIFKY